MALFYAKWLAGQEKPAKPCGRRSLKSARLCASATERIFRFTGARSFSSADELLAIGKPEACSHNIENRQEEAERAIRSFIG